MDEIYKLNFDETKIPFNIFISTFYQVIKLIIKNNHSTLYPIIEENEHNNQDEYEWEKKIELEKENETDDEDELERKDDMKNKKLNERWIEEKYSITHFLSNIISHNNSCDYYSSPDDDDNLYQSYSGPKVIYSSAPIRFCACNNNGDNKKDENEEENENGNENENENDCYKLYPNIIMLNNHDNDKNQDQDVELSVIERPYLLYCWNKEEPIHKLYYDMEWRYFQTDIIPRKINYQLHRLLLYLKFIYNGDINDNLDLKIKENIQINYDKIIKQKNDLKMNRQVNTSKTASKKIKVQSQSRSGPDNDDDNILNIVNSLEYLILNIKNVNIMINDITKDPNLFLFKMQWSNDQCSHFIYMYKQEHSQSQSQSVQIHMCNKIKTKKEHKLDIINNSYVHSHNTDNINIFIKEFNKQHENKINESSTIFNFHVLKTIILFYSEIRLLQKPKQDSNFMNYIITINNLFAETKLEKYLDNFETIKTYIIENIKILPTDIIHIVFQYYFNLDEIYASI